VGGGAACSRIFRLECVRAKPVCVPVCNVSVCADRPPLSTRLCPPGVTTSFDACADARACAPVCALARCVRCVRQGVASGAAAGGIRWRAHGPIPVHVLRRLPALPHTLGVSACSSLACLLACLLAHACLLGLTGCLLLCLLVSGSLFVWLLACFSACLLVCLLARLRLLVWLVGSFAVVLACLHTLRPVCSARPPASHCARANH
jgi:hypothetical protein